MYINSMEQLDVFLPFLGFLEKIAYSIAPVFIAAALMVFVLWALPIIFFNIVSIVAVVAAAFELVKNKARKVFHSNPQKSGITPPVGDTLLSSNNSIDCIMAPKVLMPSDIAIAFLPPGESSGMPSSLSLDLV